MHMMAVRKISRMNSHLIIDTPKATTRSGEVINMEEKAERHSEKKNGVQIYKYHILSSFPDW